MRWVPAWRRRQREPAHPTRAVAALPALALRRQVNRGFEAIAVSQDGTRLHLAFQSPLAHPDEAAHAAARHVRIWTLNASDGKLLAQYLYELDEPASFLRDAAEGPVQRSDIKVSEIVCFGNRQMLVLERASATTKLYAVTLDPDCALPVEHSDEATRPTVEELSALGQLDLPVLRKSLVLNSDDHPEIEP